MQETKATSIESDDPTYSDLVEGLDKYEKYVGIIEKENYDFKKKNEANSIVINKAFDKIKELKNHIEVLQKKSSESNKGLSIFMKKIGKGLDDSYKQECDKKYELYLKEMLQKI